MKALFIIFSLSFSTFASAQPEIEYDCLPLEYDTNVEAAKILTNNGSTQLAYYTESETWGAVDEFIVDANVTRDERSVVAQSESATLTIDLTRTVGDIAGEFMAELNLNNQMTQLFCVKGAM